jgi:outer membrane protein TolC
MDNQFKDRTISLGQTSMSVIRIECLLEELIFQQILSRNPDLDEANNKFKIALTNVDQAMKQRIEELPLADQ